MDLINIKKELFELEKQNDSISKKIRNIYDEIETENKNSEEYNYSEIKNLSNYVQLNSHPLSEEEDFYLKEIYIRMILEFIKLNKNQTNKKDMLIYAQWILDKINLNIELSDLLTKKRFDFNSLVKEVIESISEEYREKLFFDLILISGLSDNKKELYINLADFSSILGVGNDTIIKLLDISKYILTKEISDNLDITYVFTKYEEYLFKEEKDKLIFLKREVVYAVKRSSVTPEEKEKIKKIKYFKKGEMIVENTFLKFTSILNREHLIMPCSGFVYKYTGDVDKNGEQVIVYIVSTEYDNINDIKEYVKKGLSSGKIKVGRNFYKKI